MEINTTGYSSNQFLGLSNYESTPINRQAKDNPEFYFPGKRTPNIYDAPGTRPENNPQVQRGFIRGIFPEVIKKIQQETVNNQQTRNRYANLPTAPTRRCFFQFNPSLILRSVQASTTTLNPLLQDPAQLLQPIPGQASFEFQLLFNREHEVSAQEYIDANGVLKKTKPLTQNLADYGADATTDSAGLPYSQSQLGDLGVLVDLYVLDSIIGQSITQDSIDSIRTYWEATKNLRPGEELDKDGNPKQPYADTNFLTDTTYTESLQKVLGNSAFLNPMPIRIVFSSLFMVEGFVTASNVAFHKFSRNMVPTVCQVTLSVQAMYIGFAKQDSYVTSQLTESINNDVADDEETSANVDTCLKLLNKHVQVDLENMKYTVDYTSGTFNGLATDPLNEWFYKVYSTGTHGANGVTDAEWLTYRYGLDLGTPESAVSERNRSLKMWTSPTFKERNLTDARNLTLEHMHVFFYDVGKLPADLNTVAKLVEKAEKGQLSSGTTSTVKYQAKTRIWWIDRNKSADKQQGLLADAAGDDAPNKFEEASRDSKYLIDWWAEDIRTHGLDAESFTRPAEYFGRTEVIVLVICTLSAGSKSATAEDTINKVYKAAGVSLNPRTQGIADVPHLRFGAR